MMQGCSCLTRVNWVLDYSLRAVNRIWMIGGQDKGRTCMKGDDQNPGVMT